MIDTMIWRTFFSFTEARIVEDGIQNGKKVMLLGVWQYQQGKINQETGRD